MSRALALVLLAACGTTSARVEPDARTPDAPDARPDAPARRRFVEICGQSNAAGRGLVIELAGPEQLAYLDPFPAVPLAANYDGTERPIGPLAPYPATTVDEYGIELSLGRALDAATPNGWAIGKFARGGTSLAFNWAPSGALFAQLEASIDLDAVALDADLAAIIWIQGERDAQLTTGAGVAYGANLATFAGLLRARYGVPFIYGRLNAAFVGAGTGTADVRAGEAADQGPGLIMVDQDPFPLRADHTHYAGPALIALGQAYAAVVLAN